MTFNFFGFDHIPYYNDPVFEERNKNVDAKYMVFDEYRLYIEDFVKNNSIEESLILLPQFKSKNDYLNLDDVYLDSLEAKAAFPTAAVFTNTARNNLHIKIVERCFNAKKMMEDESIKRAYILITSDFEKPDSAKFIKTVYSSFDSFNNQEWFLIQIYMFLFFDWETKDEDEKRFRNLISKANCE